MSESDVSVIEGEQEIGQADAPYEVSLRFGTWGGGDVPGVCYAMAHNRVPILRSLKITPLGGVVASRLTVRFSGEWAVNDRSPIKPAEIVLDLHETSKALLVEPVSNLQLSDIALAELEERAPATVIIELEDDLGRFQRIKRDIDVYPRDQWIGSLQFMVLTASFVQPNHPDVTQVLNRAARILESSGHPGLSGYQQAESGQHHRIAKAVFEALQEFVTSYINPPAKINEIGQQIRPIDRVLSEKHGTCIDLACAYASCLEQAGLHPVIFIVKGHAFSGYLTSQEQLSDGVLDSWPAIQNILDSGLVQPVETVGIPEKYPFEEAKRATLKNLNEQSMFGVLDVRQAHVRGIRPLPARIVRDNVLTIVIDNGPSEAPVVERRDAVTRKLLPETVPARIQLWKNALLDLSFRNRLLNLRIDRQGLAGIAPLGSLGWIEDHLNDEGELEIRADDALDGVQLAAIQRAGQMEQDQLEKNLKKARTLFVMCGRVRFKNVLSRLQSDARTQEEETGANCLYLTLGSVKWSSKYGEYSSPVFLVPIRIKKSRGNDAALVQMDLTQGTTVNHCLIEALRLREQMALQWFSDDMADDAGLDIEAGLEALRSEFRAKGLDKQGFVVDQTVNIAMLDFKKFRLWRDLSDHWQEFMNSALVKHLVETPREVFNDPFETMDSGISFDDTTTQCVQSADGSQIEAIERALAGETFVLQGPPGSGKSQTITNLLANAMYRGKKVLFVAEKQAALQEVQERLEEAELGPYFLSLHDSGTNPEELRIQLRDALEQDPRINEDIFKKFEEEFSALVGQLDDYRRKVFGKNDAGFSFAESFTRLCELGSGPTVEVPREFLDLDEGKVADLRRKTLTLEGLTVPAQVNGDRPWAIAGEIDFLTIDRNLLSSLLERIMAESRNVGSIEAVEFKSALRSVGSIEELQMIADLLEYRDSRFRVGASDFAKVAFPSWMMSVEKNLNEWSSVLLHLPPSVRGHEDVLHDGSIRVVGAAVLSAAGSFVIGRKKRIAQVLGPMAPIVDTGTMDAGQVIETVNAIIAASVKIQELWSELRALPCLEILDLKAPHTFQELSDLGHLCEMLHAIGKGLSEPSAAFEPFRKLWAYTGVLPIGLDGRVRQLVEDLVLLSRLLGGSEATFRAWCSPGGPVEAVNNRCASTWTTSIETGTYLSLQRWLSLKEYLLPFRRAGLEEMCEDIECGLLDASSASQALERGILATTLKVRAEEADLDVFDGNVQSRRVARFVELLAKRQQQSRKIIPYFLNKSRHVNGAINAGKIREFRHLVNQPGKRRRGRSIRALIERFPDIVSDLTPCFLMSPDSVAQFVPPGTVKFDIVVFDEASQIVTADAIGAIGRATSCVIVGDSKQMPPTRFGAVDQSDEVDADLVDFDEDSILEEAVAAGVEERLLKWHYRSHDESLIIFSNVHYYEKELLTFPSPVDFRKDCGVFYRRVNGQFDHGKTRTNDIEARAIVEELIKRLDDPATAELSYGIVTLNIQQQNLISSILDSSNHPKIAELRETEDKKRRLFVLNLENVQGRERDVILFGTSFSRRADGGAMPLNFGPLTQAGGERRLNVAITRAKRQFVVVSSFDPEDMAAASSVGMNDLRDYLFAARHRTRGEAVTGSNAGSPPYMQEIVEALEDKGLIVTSSRGLSNFKVDLALTLPSHKDEWLVAVLFDGERWSQHKLAIDREAVPAIVLQDIMRWPRVVRVWLPAVRLDMADVVADLAEQTFLAARDVESGGFKGPSSAMASDSTDTPPEGLVIESPQVPNDQPTRALPNEVSYTKLIMQGVPQDPNLLNTTGARSVLENLIDVEGPMEVVEALKRVASIFGVQRVREARLKQMTVLLGTRRDTKALGNVYLWPKDVDPDQWRLVRRTPHGQRPIPHISPYEIVNAMEEVVRQSLSISQPELVKWIATYFGVAKVGVNISDYLNQCLEWALSVNRLVRNGSDIVVP